MRRQVDSDSRAVGMLQRSPADVAPGAAVFHQHETRQVQFMTDTASAPAKEIAFATRDEFLTPAKRRFKPVHLPSGKTVQIQSLLVSEMRQLRNSFSDNKGDIILSRSRKMQELLIGRCVVDANKARMLTDDDVMAGALDKLDGADTAMLFAECKAWTGFGNDGDWSAIEEAGKNLEGSPAS